MMSKKVSQVVYILFWLWISIAAAILTGGLIGLLHSVVSVSFRVDQIISHLDALLSA